MNARILEILRSYLIGDIDFNTLEDRVIPLAWEVDDEYRDFVDQIAVEISYVKDDASDEDLFRVRVADLIVPEVSQAVV